MIFIRVFQQPLIQHVFACQELPGGPSKWSQKHTDPKDSSRDGAGDPGGTSGEPAGTVTVPSAPLCRPLARLADSS